MSAMIRPSFSLPALITLGVIAAGILAVSALPVSAAPPENGMGMPPPIPLPMAVPNTTPGNAPVPVPMGAAPVPSPAPVPGAQAGLPPRGSQAAPASTGPIADVATTTGGPTVLTEAEKQLTLESLRDKLVVTRDETWVYRDQMQYLDMLKTYSASINSVQ